MTSLAEVVVADGIGAALALFLITFRMGNKQNLQVGARYFDTMCWITFCACITEIFAFTLDGRYYAGALIVQYVLNTLMYVFSSCAGLLWVLFVELKTYGNLSKVKKYPVGIYLPATLAVVFLVMNLFVQGFIFSIDENYVYSRGGFAWLIYAVIIYYCLYSIGIIVSSRQKGIRIRFFPISYFIIPTLIGILVQGLYYGMALGWSALALSLVFVYVSMQNETIYIDGLTGLYNRNFLDVITAGSSIRIKNGLYGIMIDMDDFKVINDTYGHLTGDDAIREVGELLMRSITENCIALRYAGDEFIVLVESDTAADVDMVMDFIRNEAKKFNEQSKKPYKLSFSMGYSYYDSSRGNMDLFLQLMDQNMYEEKRGKKASQKKRSTDR